MLASGKARIFCNLFSFHSINFSDKNCYKCIECGKVYENPNPLKFHMATNCERYAIDELWNRLMRSTLANAMNLPKHLPFSSTIYSPAAIPSANFFPHYFPLTNSLPLSLPPTDISGNSEKTIAAAAAQLETIVSNMGSSKQGHVCIYCGKLYSRKYGLKIHIRTHTNYKPLKCKFCFRPFGDPSNLNKHIRLHVQEKSLHKCKLCGKIMVRRRDLIRHMNLKHSENHLLANGAENQTISSPSRCSNDGNSQCSGSSDGSCIALNADDDGDDNDDDDVEPLEVD